MELRPLGKTGVQIPVIGLGMWEYRGSVEPLRRGIELGASFIDTAEMYSTEGATGEAVRGLRDAVFVATKVLASHARYREVLEAADRSLRRLKTDYIDLYQLHSSNLSVPIGETMGAMEELVDQGKVRFIGVSNFSVAQLREAQQAMAKYEIVSNQVLYSLLDRAIEGDLMPYCQQQQVTVIAYSPLGQGKLTSRPPPKRRQAMTVLEAIASETRRTVVQVALNWCISRPNVVAIPKSDKMEHVVENCGASGWSLSTAQIEALDTAFQ